MINLTILSKPCKTSQSIIKPYDTTQSPKKSHKKFGNFFEHFWTYLNLFEPLGNFKTVQSVTKTSRTLKILYNYQTHITNTNQTILIKPCKTSENISKPDETARNPKKSCKNFLNIFEHFWTILNIFEHFWTFLKLFEPFWTL